MDILQLLRELRYIVARPPPGRFIIKTADEVDADKLRGGFYTPDSLVAHVLERATRLLGDTPSIRVFEPSVGDGAFIRGLGQSRLADRTSELVGVEIESDEATVAVQSGLVQSFRCDVHHGDVVELSLMGRFTDFDLAIGNPPFVRFQFVPDGTKAAADVLASTAGLPARRVGNLWIPVLLAALEALRPNGVFAFVLPTELLTGVSAKAIREYLAARCDDLTLDMFAPREFPGVLQRVTVLSGRRRTERPSGHPVIEIVDHDADDRWVHLIEPTADTWTRYLLTPAQLEAFHLSLGRDVVVPVGNVAKFEVAAVTGANAYFSLTERDAAERGLAPWTVKLLPRLRYAPGLVYDEDDHVAAIRAGAKTALLDFSSDRPDPTASPGAADYIGEGESQGIHKRYKTRIRTPWYRVPHIRSEPLMMSKRTHHHPRVVLNEVGAVSTDTIYRGRVTTPELSPGDVAAVFHNSLTLLTAELSGRSFGGGVLELVPSEIARLSLPSLQNVSHELPMLDKLARCDPTGDELIRGTNELLAREGTLDVDVLNELEGARRRLRNRRFSE